jgi:hypothetical protein
MWLLITWLDPRTYCVAWPSNCGSCLAICFGFGIFPADEGHCASSWGCCGLGMVWDARSSKLGSVPHIYFLLLIIRSLYYSSFSFKSYVVICSLAWICLGDLLDEVRGHLACGSCSFNSEILTLNVEASFTLVGTSFGGICYKLCWRKNVTSKFQ